MSPNKLKAKDLVTIAIFGVVFMLTYLLCALPAGLIAELSPFCVAVGMIPSGIVWTYIRAKAPKRFAILVQCAIFAIITFLRGSGWFVAVGILAGAFFAEILAGIGKYKSFRWNTAGYAAFAVCLNLGLFSLMLFARDYYYNFCIESGQSAAYIDARFSIMSWPLLLLTTALSVVGAWLGMLLGRVMLKKHFAKAGIV
ncbi:MAG: MptD family putative ECF transporter S component [Oscillospiraceae bacterium]|jgi:energy-coupling factor transport system substrate-specific component|nr:MptD family putative ECF transporter S component [Oscillospiraceae bacterium]